MSTNPAPAQRRDQPSVMRHPFARLLSLLRGDKYMVDAYPEEDSCWRCGTEWTSEDAPRTTSTPAALPVAVAHKKAA